MLFGSDLNWGPAGLHSSLGCAMGELTFIEHKLYTRPHAG